MSFSHAGFAKLCFAIILFSFLSNNSKAQTTLVKGDIAFTGYYSNGTAPSLNDQFSFVLLTGITNNTVINFTDNGWLRTSPTTGSFRTGEGTVTYTSNGAYAAGTEILITITSGTTATATLVGGASAGTATGSVMPNFSANGDQVIAYQGTTGSPTFISAIHLNVYSVASIPPDIPGGDGVTTTTTEWDGAENTANASGLPALGGSNFLTNGTDALWIPGSIIAEKDNARFNGCALPMGNAAAARAAINNVANWITNDGDPSAGPPAFGILPTGCSYITALPAPSFTTNPSSVTICENANTTFTVAASNATGFQWQVDNGGGFTNITNNTVYSGATTTSLTITGATTSMDGYLYRAVASNGSGSTNSTSATLTVTTLPVNPTLLAKTPATIIVADGTNVSATFNAGSGGTGCADDYRYTTNGGATYLPYTPGTNISTTGLAAGSGYVFIEGRRANCSSSCQNSYVVLASWQVSPLPGGATTLAAGDIAFSGYIGGNSIAADEFSFVLLRNMGAGTTINFTSTGWLSTNTFGAAEETVTWTVPAGGLPAGTEIRIAGTTATRSGPGAAGTVTGTALTFSVNGDQVLAYTGSSGSPTFISGIHTNVYTTANGDPVTTSAAAWDGTASGINASALPTGLTTGTNAIWIGVSGDINSEFDNAKFGNCNNPAVPGSISALRAALNNRLNWITSNGGDPASFTLPTGCNYLSTLCPTITVTNPATATGVAGTAFSQTFTSAGGVPTVTYATSSTLPTGLTLSPAGVLSGTPTQTGTFPIVVVATDGGGCTGTGSTYTLVISCPVLPTPTITPGGPTTFCTGGSVILTSSAATNNQWYVGGNPIGGATNQTYTATASGSYTVVQTSPYAGCNSSPSAAVVVTVNTTPATPTVTPGGPTTFCAGGSVTLTSSAASGNQWYVGGNPIGGATNQTYAATASGVYTVVVTLSGCSSAPSSGTTVTVNPIPATPTVTPGGPTTFCTGGSVVLTSSSASGNQWYVGGNPIGGATNQTYTATASGTYTVVVTASGCNSAPSAGTIVTVNTTPATPTITPGGPTTFCAGGSVVLTSSAASGNQWYVGGNPIGGATNQTYTATASGTYTVVVTQSGCSSAPSAGTTVTVNPIPATPTVTPGGPTTFCAGGSVVLTSSAASGNQWYVGGNPIGGATNQTYTATASGVYTVVVTLSGCSSASSAGTTVTVNPIPVATATPSAQTICSGGTITTIVLSSSVGGTTYNWTRDNAAGVTGIAASGSGDISGSLTNTTTAPVTVTFTITPTANSCPGAAITATVLVNPVPDVVKPADQVLCNTQSTNAINFTGTIPGTTYNWTNNNTSIGLASAGTGNIGSFVATNTGTTPQVATITVTPSYGAINQTETFNYTGGMQTWTVPAGVTSITIDAYGAGGGTGASGTGSGGAGGNGSRATGTLAVTPGQVLNIFVGGAGAVSTGGYNGGGTGGNSQSGGGGGASDIRYPGTAAGDRLIVAGGGGGGGRGGCESTSTINGGAGGHGDTNGGNGTDAPTSGGNAGAGGGGISTGAGGAAGIGCAGFVGQPGQAGTAAGIGGAGGAGQACCCFSSNSIPGGGGGGGGYLGGGGGGGGSAGTVGCSGNDKGAGGGGAGGTSYIGGVTAGSTTSGVQTGNGLVVITYSVPGCTGTPQTSTITVNPTPTATAAPSSQTICSGPITTIAITGSVSGTTFNWTRDNTAGVTGIAASGSGDISGSLVNTTAAPLTVTFTITPTANGCTGTPITATVIVNPAPAATATPASQTVCSGPITTINLTSTVTSTTYAWTRDNTVNVTGIAASGIGSSISGTLTNNTTVPQTVTFTITPTSPDGCPGTPITATVTVNAVPTITCPANIVVSNDANQCGAIVTYTPTVTGIPAPTITYVLTGATTGSGNGNASGTLFNIGTTTVSLTATNTCGTANCSFTVTVNDTQNPTITCPAPVTVSCVSAVPAVNTGAVTAADNCPGVVVTHRGDVISAQTCANRYTITRTYRATDASGNFVECTQIITVNDQTPPVMTCPAPVTVSCASAVPAPNIAAVTGVSDNCGGTVTVIHVGDVISAQTCANRYTITRTYRATDVCGNFAECTQIITVNDQTPPVITCPAPVTVSCASAVPAANIALVTATDNCAGAVTITHVGDVISAQTCANRYTITRTYRATDVCGNFAECTQIITVNDQTPPVITCPANVTVNTPAGSCTAVVNFAATATDNCAGTITYSYSHAPGSAFPIGVTTVTATATDVCGNSASCTFTITVNDGQLPVITAQPVNRTVCAGTTATFSVTAVTAPNAGGPLSYQWELWNGSSWNNVAGATSATLTLNNVTHSMNDNSYRVRVIGLCTTVISNFATLRVNPLPTISITASPLSVLTPGQTTTLTAVTNQPGGTYVWLLNGQPTGATGPTLGGLTIDNLGAYSVRYTDPNGCVSTSAVIDISALQTELMWVYPNPNFGQFQVRVYSTSNTPFTVNVYDSKGARVFTRTASPTQAYTSIPVDLGMKAMGMYIVELRDNTGRSLGSKQVMVHIR